MKECLFCRTTHEDREMNCPECGRILVEMPEVLAENPASRSERPVFRSRTSNSSNHSNPSVHTESGEFTGNPFHTAGSGGSGDLRQHFMPQRRRGIAGWLTDNWESVRTVIRVVLIAAGILLAVCNWEMLLASALAFFVGAVVVTAIVSIPFRRRGLPEPIMNASMVIGGGLGFAFYYNLGSVRDMAFSAAGTVAYYMVLGALMVGGIRMLLNIGRARR